MLIAVKQAQGALGAPTVGTWFPAIGIGAPLTPNRLLGHLQRAGRLVEVRAPRTASGAASSVVSGGTWVEYDATLVTRGTAQMLADGEGEAAVTSASEALPPGTIEVVADTDGTVYLHPEPGSPPFAAEGTAVGAQRTLALVEVMKTFTPVRAPVSGTVARVLVEDSASVTAGEPLFWIAVQG